MHEEDILLSPSSAVIVVVVGSITKNEVPTRSLLMKSAPKNSYGKSVFELYLLTAIPSFQISGSRKGTPPAAWMIFCVNRAVIHQASIE